MNTLYFSTVERRNFGDLISVESGSRLTLKSARELDSLLQVRLPDKSVLAVWADDPGVASQLPALIICHDGTESDWAAWITTFGARIRPFTAFTRLITRSGFENLVTKQRTPTLMHLTWAAVGLVLGEVLAASRLPDKSLESLPANACQSTLSFAMFRAAAAYSSFHQWRELAESYEKVRQATSQHVRLIDGRQVARVCATVIEAGNLGDTRELLEPQDQTVARACQELIFSPELAPASLSSIPEFASIESKMRGPREDRVVSFTEFVRTIDKSNSASTQLVSFVLGYLASRIAPGTIQHSSVLEPVAQRYGSALLWYGFCAGLGVGEAIVRNGIGAARSAVDLPGIARRVARDLLRAEPILAAPSCDISYLELLALSRTDDDPLAGLIRTTQGTATVDLAPAVWTVVNVSPKPALDIARRSAKEKQILTEMGEHLRRIQRAYSELMESDEEEAGQQSLFRRKPKGR